MYAASDEDIHSFHPPEDLSHGHDRKDKGTSIRLSSAVSLDGLCIGMASDKEVQERTLRDELSAFEKSGGKKTKDKVVAVKRLQRSSASHKLDIPSEIRPPGYVSMMMI